MPSYLYTALFLFSCNLSFSQSIDDVIPSGAKGQVVQHQEYTLCYSEQHEQAFWVAYELTAAELRLPSRKRESSFKTDPYVATKSASHKDYTNSGYDRGHISRAEFNKSTASSYRESYYMSNISPQIGVNFNRRGGDWYKLEELEKKIAFKLGSIYVVSGPIFQNNLGVIGTKTKITVPGFFKAFLSQDKSQAIAFVLKHDNVDVDSLWATVVTIDELEEFTNFNFYPTLSINSQAKLEGTVSLNYWKALVK